MTRAWPMRCLWCTAVLLVLLSSASSLQHGDTQGQRQHGTDGNTLQDWHRARRNAMRQRQRQRSDAEAGATHPEWGEEDHKTARKLADWYAEAKERDLAHKQRLARQRRVKAQRMAEAAHRERFRQARAHSARPRTPPPAPTTAAHSRAQQQHRSNSAAQHVPVEELVADKDDESFADALGPPLPALLPQPPGNRPPAPAPAPAAAPAAPAPAAAGHRFVQTGDSVAPALAPVQLTIGSADRNEMARIIWSVPPNQPFVLTNFREGHCSLTYYDTHLFTFGVSYVPNATAEDITTDEDEELRFRVVRPPQPRFQQSALYEDPGLSASATTAAPAAAAAAAGSGPGPAMDAGLTMGRRGTDEADDIVFSLLETAQRTHGRTHGRARHARSAVSFLPPQLHTERQQLPHARTDSRLPTPDRRPGRSVFTALLQMPDNSTVKNADALFNNNTNGSRNASNASNNTSSNYTSSNSSQTIPDGTPGIVTNATLQTLNESRANQTLNLLSGNGTQQSYLHAISIDVHGTLQLRPASNAVVVREVPQWALVQHDDFETHAHGWSDTFRTICAADNVFLGGYCHSAGLQVNKTFGGLPPHKFVRVTANYHFFDKWEGQSGWTKLDGVVVWTEKHHHCPKIFSELCSGISVCGDEEVSDRVGTLLDVTIPHSSTNLTVTFGSSLTDAGTRQGCDASYGVDDVMIWLL